MAAASCRRAGARADDDRRLQAGLAAGVRGARRPGSARSRRFSGGASGQAQRGSNAHDGWKAKLKSRISVPAAGSPPRSALLAASTR